MQKYWYMQENESKDATIKIRSYGMAENSSDAIEKANKRTLKTEPLIRVWLAYLPSPEPVFSLIFGEPGSEGRTIPLDNASRGIAANYRETNGMSKKKVKKIKPRVKIAAAAKKPPPYYPYIVDWASTFLKEKGNETNSTN